MSPQKLLLHAVVLTQLASLGCALDTTGTAAPPVLDGATFDDGVLADGSIVDTADEDTAIADGGAIDAAAGDGADTGTIDTGAIDTGAVDTGAIDTGAVDTGAVDTGTIDTGAIDTGAVDTGTDTSTCDEGACGALPVGAKRVALVDRTVPCPPGFTSTDVVEGTGGNGCGCSCTLSSSPTCPGVGTLETAYGATSACASKGATLSPSGSGVCAALGFSGTLDKYFAGTAPGPIGGACTPAATVDESKVSRPRRICEPLPSTCAAPICGTPFTECIEIAGACPAAFPNARPVGIDVVLGCPACTCAMSAKCSGTIDLFSNGSCGGSKTTLPIDGTCAAVPSGAGSVSSYRYTPNAPTASCSPSFATAPGTRTFIGQRNLCCR